MSQFIENGDWGLGVERLRLEIPNFLNAFKLSSSSYSGLAQCSEKSTNIFKYEDGSVRPPSNANFEDGSYDLGDLTLALSNVHHSWHSCWFRPAGDLEDIVRSMILDGNNTHLIQCRSVYQSGLIFEKFRCLVGIDSSIPDRIWSKSEIRGTPVWKAWYLTYSTLLQGDEILESRSAVYFSRCRKRRENEDDILLSPQTSRHPGPSFVHCHTSTNLVIFWLCQRRRHVWQFKLRYGSVSKWLIPLTSWSNLV